ncbi:MAG: DUF3177 family protein, partial [Cyanobium sp.]
GRPAGGERHRAGRAAAGAARSPGHCTPGRPAAGGALPRSGGLALTSLSCLRGASASTCRAWLEAPRGLNVTADHVLDFIFGADWTPAAAAFLGYLGLVAYAVGLLQWLLVRLPRQGRIAGEF